jgi:hypothetical protein
MKRTLFLLLFASSSLFAQKAKNYSVVTDELTSKIIATVPSGKSMHVAVVPFTSTDKSGFGEYVTETIIGSLTGQPDKIKVFERTRLDAILKEQQFILTDLMKPAAALKIGQFAPIDALLSGTYTKLKSYIDVNARLIDIASGEISVSFNGRIKMTKNLATLFNHDASHALATTNSNPGELNVSVTNNSGNAVTPTPKKTRREICEDHGQHMQSFIEDLTTDEQVNKAVNEAMKIPFEYNCDAHLLLTHALTQYKIFNDPYKQFLLKGLDTLKYQYGDDRDRMIARYVSADDNVDEIEWTKCREAMKRLEPLEIRIFIENLIAAPSKPEFEAKEKWIAQYFDLANNNQLAVPRRMTFDEAFFTMLDGLKNNPRLREGVYTKYSGSLHTDDHAKSKLFSALRSVYNENESAHKPTTMMLIVNFVNENEYPKAPDELYEFAIRLQSDSDPNLAALVTNCRNQFSKYALRTEYNSQKEDRIEFCVINNIPIPGVIPTLDEANAILIGNNAAEQQRVMNILVLMNDRPKKLETSLVGLFDKRSLDDREKLADAQTNAIMVLGNIKTSSAKAIDYMITVLPHYGNDTEAAEKSLVQIGKPAVAALTSRLDKTTANDGGLQFQLISILGKIGRDAASAERSITRVLNSTSNSDIKYAAEAALQEFKK